MAQKRRQPQNEEITEKCHRSTSTKVSAEDKKKRQREWYAKNAVRIREKSRVQVAEKRAAIKAKRRKSDKPRTSQRKLTSDELIASVALTQMREQQELPAVRRGMVPQTDNTVDAPQPVASDFPIAAPLTSAEAAVDKEIEDLLEQGAEAPPLESESSSEDEDLDIGVGGVSATSGGVAITVDKYASNLMRRRSVIEGLSSILISGSQLRIRAQELRAKRRRRLRLPTPTSISPSPEPEGRLPSFYEKLWRTVEKRVGNTSSLV
ncbi:hypothetical protein B0H13DRAFT_1872866 [Mycena leptocephala]|nr:hypothetical protein B0H13DRAFT_1872866 [Mycena leptocephala]